ncbi:MULTISPECIES: class I SAM-dependent methyltransferase [unclassified Bradyrhizobium]|uniref:class I SAM-dependent methyltransferase n=1 Tax=unclassified Bradyrhizobium TaxID=2631580 RepID=UPI00247944E7|nr:MULTISPECIES: class I SAM-dependent methyltransferase [unclassified Bradyrhizobium]WGS17032.1 class I SAM-dependent methyltransferase [Bradyrhizobium sp. ISRA463]WGS30752.1 class I SAM-dependent methyltransferase [Bradyrhizobium sp. ISRA464]
MERQFGRQAFGADPAGYHNARPAYPEWVYETLSSRCALRRNTATFEIGAGTGKATRRLLELGADPLTVIEPDPRLADFLRNDNADVALRVIVAPFEDAELEEQAFDLGVSATSFHWLDGEKALAKIVRLLRPGGWWVAVWNVFGDDSQPDPFHEATTQLLKGPTGPSISEGGKPFALDTAARLAALQHAGGFHIVDHSTSRWPLVLDAEQTVALYSTYSNISARLDRERVLAELGRIARDQFAGRVVRNMTTSLYIARRAQ